MKRIKWRMLAAAAVMIVASGALPAQEPATAVPAADTVKTTALAAKAEPQPAIAYPRVGVGMRMAMLDKTTFFVNVRPSRMLGLAAGGYIHRKTEDQRNSYDHRFQAEADVYPASFPTVGPFIGLRYCWEESREDQSYPGYDIIYSGDHTDDYEIDKTRRFDLNLGAEFIARRIGVQVGVSPFYDSRTTTTRHYQYWDNLYPGTYRDTTVTSQETVTGVDVVNLFVSFRFIF